MRQTTIACISQPLEPARGRNGLRWFAVSDQAKKNRLVKNVLLEKERHNANSTTRFE
jgi:hypothetical protein